MADTLAKWIGPLVAIAIAIISASVSIGSSRAEIEVLKDQQKDNKVEIENLNVKVQALEIKLATSISTLSNIDRSLVEIKDDIKDLKRGQNIVTTPSGVRLK